MSWIPISLGTQRGTLEVWGLTNEVHPVHSPREKISASPSENCSVIIILQN